jgi:creatinine amidohydrolase
MRLDVGDATWTDVANADVAAALLPVGSTEQHGPHAPLGTDTLIARSVAERGAEGYDDRSPGGDVIAVAPALPVGVAAEHRGFDGTLHAPPDAVRAYLRGTAASLRETVDAPVVIVNGHGGNTPSIREVAAGLMRDGHRRVAAFTWFEALDAYPGAMGHGGPVETAVLRHLRPDLVREERAADAAAGAAEEWGHHAGGTNLAYDADAFSESGVVGDPRPDQGTPADAERGAELMAEAVDALTDVIGALVDGTAGA